MASVRKLDILKQSRHRLDCRISIENDIRGIKVSREIHHGPLFQSTFQPLRSPSSENPSPGRARVDSGQLVLTTSSVFGHRSDVTPSTTVDLPTVAGSRWRRLPILTVDLPSSPSSVNSSWCPSRTTLSTTVPGSFTNSAFLSSFLG